MTAAARELARKVAASVDTVVLRKVWLDASATNSSSATSFEFEQALAGFENEWKKNGGSGFVVVAQVPPTVTDVRISLSENFQGFLWIAEIITGTAHNVVFVSIPKSAVPAAASLATDITLSKQFLLSLPDPILDARILPASASTAERLVVLQPERVALFEQISGAWQIQAEAPIEHDHPWPRDIRGALESHTVNLNGNDEKEEAVLPGVVCSISLSGKLTVACMPGNQRWSISGASPVVSSISAYLSSAYLLQNRNLFSYAIGGVAEQFYSIAEFELNSEEHTVVGTTSDGRALLFEGSRDPTAAFLGWGSDIVALAAPDRLHWPLLVTRSDDWTRPDAIQAFNIVDRQAAPASGAVNFDGPVTALWSAEEDTAVVVSHNLKTGMYDAYLLHATYRQ